MLFRNSYINRTFWKFFTKCIKTSWAEHRCSNCHKITSFFPKREKFI